MNLEVLQFVAMGFLGGLTFVLIKAEGWEDLKKFKMARRLIIGAIVGLLYFQIYSEHNFPNMVMSFVSGYMGTDFIEALIEKVKRKKDDKVRAAGRAKTVTLAGEADEERSKEPRRPPLPPFLIL